MYILKPGNVLAHSFSKYSTWFRLGLNAVGFVLRVSEFKEHILVDRK